jgi:hypothetical protein
VLHLAVQFTMGGVVVVVVAVALFLSSSVELACEDEETVQDGYSGSEAFIFCFKYSHKHYFKSYFFG